MPDPSPAAAGAPDALTLVVNPASGRGRAGRLLPELLDDLRTARPDLKLIVEQTSSYADAQARCADAVARAATAPQGRGALVVMGGDGMAHLGVNACAGTAVPLGVVPAGTGNDFCRGTGLPTTVEGAIAAVERGSARRIDVSRLAGAGLAESGDRFVGSVVSTGYDARVNRRTNHMPTTFGSLGYGWAALAELARFQPLTYRLEIDGRQRELRAMFVAVGNAGFFGGGMRVCPDARVDDGELDLTIVHPVGRATLLRLLPAMYNGTFVRNPAIERLRARTVRVDGDDLFVMGDGEELGAVPVTVTCEPEALSVLG